MPANIRCCVKYIIVWYYKEKNQSLTLPEKVQEARRTCAMASETKKRSQLSVLFFIGSILFNYSILSLFSDESKEIFGIPLLYAYVFVTWALLISLTFLTVMEHRRQESHASNKVE
jgi:hypothetical protein